MDEELIRAESDEEEKSDKSVSSDLIRGHINTIILRSLYDGDKYGYEIIAEIERKSSGQYSLKQPSLYSALKRLEKDGYITSYWGGSVGGGRRKYFSLTDEGKAVSEQNQAEWEYSRTIIDSLISDRDFDFANPAPTAVDMRVLKRSTSRVPSREDGEEEELDFEPAFDDTSLRDKLEEEYKEKQTALEAEYGEKIAALDRERTDFEAEKLRLAEEQTRREEALMEERNRMLQDLQILRERQEEELREARERQQAELLSEQDQRHAEDDALKTELELQRQKYDEMEARHEEELAAAREAGRRGLAEEREAAEASLRIEREEHARALRELTDAHKQELREADEAAEKAREEAIRAADEKNGALLDQRLKEERERYDSLLAEERERHEAQIKDDRIRYEEALAEHDKAMRKQMEYELSEREREFKHRNYLSLVADPAQARTEKAEPPKEPHEEKEDYRTVVGMLYDNAVSPAKRPAETAEATPVSGIDFRDITARAKRDGLRVTTTGGAVPASAPAEDRENTVHRGKALFLSALVTFFWCILVGSIALGLQQKLSLPLFYPYIMWTVGLAFLLVTALAYANHFGENYLRRRVPVLVNAVVVYSLLVIVTLIVALSARADFGDTGAVMAFVGFPVIYFVGVLIFGLCYYLQTRPKKN